MKRSELKVLRDGVNSALELLDRTLEKVYQMNAEKQENSDQIPGDMNSVVLKRKFKHGTQVYFLLGRESRIYTGKVFSEAIECVFGLEEIRILEHVIEITRGDYSVHINADLVYETREELIAYLEQTTDEES